MSNHTLCAAADVTSPSLTIPTTCASSYSNISLENGPKKKRNSLNVM